ncbi:SagB/ThcOx family dehydrogenase [Thermodesulfobacteriota bacterium]
MDENYPEPAKTYHIETSYARDRMSGHGLDWNNQPLPYKHYPDAASTPLPSDVRPPKGSLWEMETVGRDNPPEAPFGLQQLATVCALTHSFTARRSIQGQTFLYRSVASAGALYPAELYLAAQRVGGLETGLYYYDIREFALKSLRSGTRVGKHFSPGATDEGHDALVTFFITGIFFRSAWKYRARALRYVLLDAGHLLENLRNALQALGLGLRIDYDFDDIGLNRLLDLDSKREAVFVSISVYGDPNAKPAAGQSTTIHPDFFESVASATGQVTTHEIFYNEIEIMHRAGMGLPKTSVPVGEDLQVTVTRPTEWLALPPYDRMVPALTYDQAVVQRRSKRNFIDQPIPEAKVLSLVQLLCGAWVPGKDSNAGLQIGFLAGAVTELAAGFYLLDGLNQKIGCVRADQFKGSMASVCLDQQWLKNAGMHFLFMVNLKTLDQSWGARGYRYAMLEAGRLGQSLYLGATALGLGCCGIGALYDQEARALLGLNADSALLYLVAVGQVKGG